MLPSQDSQDLQPLFEWEALDAVPHVRGERWYACGAIVVIVASAWGLITGSLLTALLFLLIGAIYFLLRNRPPQLIRIRLTEVGISVRDEVLPWSQFRDFWFLIGREYCELHLGSAVRFSSDRKFLISLTYIPKARGVLLAYLPERAGQRERMFDAITRILKL
jgi:hypothetical protein